MKINQSDIEKLLARSPSREQMDSARQRILNYVQSQDSVESLELVPEEGPRTRWGRIAMIPAAAAVMTAVFIGVAWRQDALAIGESVDGSLFRVVHGKAHSLSAGETISIGDTVRSDSGGTLRLADGSGVEVKPESELSFEGAKSALQINLSHGGVIVNSETQPVVQTKDVRVPIAGTILVNAEAEGSRVAVIQGEARVRQGAIEKTLRSGEQMATNPSMALLQQSAFVPANPSVGREANTLKWEVVSVRPCENTGGGGRGGGGGGAAVPQDQFDPERMILGCWNVRTLVASAYVEYANGQANGLAMAIANWTNSIEGLPPWWSARYTIEAKAEKAVDRGVMRGPMLRALLEDRFKLRIRREDREIPLLALTVANSGAKLKPNDGSCIVLAPVPHRQLLNPAGDRSAFPAGTVFCERMGGTAISARERIAYPAARGTGRGTGSGLAVTNMEGVTIEELITSTMMGTVAETRKPIIDKTGITGKFDFKFEHTLPPANIVIEAERSRLPTSPTIVEAIERQFGLTLVETKGPWPHLVIEHIERPSPN